MWVVLLGPDGVGKSAVIRGIGDGVAAGFAGSDAYHLRPRVFGEGKPATETDPHGRPARGVGVTAFKLLGLLAANWIAYVAVVRPRVAKGRLVLLDRYFADALVDLKRYRIPSKCRWLVRVIASLVPQPDLYVVLDAPPHVLLSRKQEVTPYEVERQRREYRLLMRVLQHCVVVDASGPVGTVVDEVVANVVDRRLSEFLPARRAA
jgi:thymidylate kinase